MSDTWYNPLLNNSDFSDDPNDRKENGVNHKLIDITPCMKAISFEDNPKYKKLDLTPSQKARISTLVSNAPKIAGSAVANAASNALGNADYYIMSVPKGLSSFLMKYRDGSGYGNTLINAQGKFAAQVPATKIDFAELAKAQAIVSSAFTVMSVATSQYYLKQINEKMDHISLGVDKILEFLYGDKKAELMAEVSFAKYALNCYTSIMDQEQQRIATISGLQQARKVAMKDAEFYISDLESTLNESIDISAKVEKMLQIEESMTLALQLCVMSTILEVDYSQNYDQAYLKYIEDDISLYIDKTEKMVIGMFNKLQVLVENSNPNLWKKFNKDHLQQCVVRVLDKFKNGGESDLTKSLKKGLHESEKTTTYYFGKNGDVYIKTA